MELKNMSVSSIKPENTVSRIIEDGITVYSNPVLSVEVYSNGFVKQISNNKFLKPNNKGLYSVKYKDDPNQYNNPTSFASLIVHLLGIERENRLTSIKLKDPSKGYIKGNIETYQRTVGRTKGELNKKSTLRLKRTNHNSDSIKSIPVALHEAETNIIHLNGFQLRARKANLTYYTEDGQSFSNRIDADAHQLLVDKGKEAALLVVNAKAGYALAESVFETQVSVKHKKYANFKDVLNCDVGVVEHGKSDTFMFLDNHKLDDFRKDILAKEFYYDEASKMTKLLNTLDETQLEILSILN